MKNQRNFQFYHFFCRKLFVLLLDGTEMTRQSKSRSERKLNISLFCQYFNDFSCSFRRKLFLLLLVLSVLEVSTETINGSDCHTISLSLCMSGDFSTHSTHTHANARRHTNTRIFGVLGTCSSKGTIRLFIFLWLLLLFVV